MSEKTVKIEFTEQSKCVVAKVGITTSMSLDSNITEHDALLEEAERLFLQAQKLALALTMQKQQ